MGRWRAFFITKGVNPLTSLLPGENELVLELGKIINSDRLKRLISRGFLLSQAIERWQARAIWVVSRSDEGYPASTERTTKRYRSTRSLWLRRSSHSPDGRSGSGRDPETPTRQYLISRPESATSLRTLNELSFPEGPGNRSGGHVRRTGGRGQGGGSSRRQPERSVLNRDHRNYLRDDRLVLLSPYDPQAGFNIGNAMQRNKLIYALADAALVVQSDYGKGGTWAGAIEQWTGFAWCRFIFS